MRLAPMATAEPIASTSSSCSRYSRMAKGRHRRAGMSGMSGFAVHVLDAQLGKLGAQTVEIQAQLAAWPGARGSWLPWRCGPALALSTSAARSRGTTTTPSTSPTMTSPGFTGAPAQTTGTFTEPGVSFTVPCEWMAPCDHTGKSIAVRSATSRTPASMTSPPRRARAPRRRADRRTCRRWIRTTVVTTRMSPGLADSRSRRESSGCRRAWHEHRDRAPRRPCAVG